MGRSGGEPKLKTSPWTSEPCVAPACNLQKLGMLLAGCCRGSYPTV